MLKRTNGGRALQIISSGSAKAVRIEVDYMTMDRRACYPQLCGRIVGVHYISLYKITTTAFECCDLPHELLWL